MYKFSIALLLASSTALCGAFTADGNSNLAMYWGQNSKGQVNSQKRLAHYCEDSTNDIILVSFLHVFFGVNGYPEVNFANACESSIFPGTNLLHCPHIGKDITYCQSRGKKVLLSLGGSAGSYGFTSRESAVEFAQTLWDLFGNGESVIRPFDEAIVDGFDLDIEGGSNLYYQDFADAMHEIYRRDPSRKYYLAAAPQCVFPDHWLNGALTKSSFDFIFVQFYNNYCNAQHYPSENFNFKTWDNFVKTQHKNKNAKVYLGLPASPAAAGSGYLTIDFLQKVAAHCQDTYSTFGGIMMWDASQAWNNVLSNKLNYAQAAKAFLVGGTSTNSTDSAAPSSTIFAQSSMSLGPSSANVAHSSMNLGPSSANVAHSSMSLGPSSASVAHLSMSLGSSSASVAHSSMSLGPSSANVAHSSMSLGSSSANVARSSISAARSNMSAARSNTSFTHSSMSHVHSSSSAALSSLSTSTMIFESVSNTQYQPITSEMVFSSASSAVSSTVYKRSVLLSSYLSKPSVSTYSVQPKFTSTNEISRQNWTAVTHSEYPIFLSSSATFESDTFLPSTSLTSLITKSIHATYKSLPGDTIYSTGYAASSRTVTKSSTSLPSMISVIANPTTTRTGSRQLPMTSNYISTVSSLVVSNCTFKLYDEISTTEAKKACPTNSHCAQEETCSTGSYRCNGNGYDQCVHDKWLSYSCAPGTSCHALYNGAIICDWPQRTTQDLCTDADNIDIIDDADNSKSIIDESVKKTNESVVSNPVTYSGTGKADGQGNDKIGIDTKGNVKSNAEGIANSKSPAKISLAFEQVEDKKYTAILKALALGKPISRHWSFTFKSHVSLEETNRGKLTRCPGTDTYRVESIPMQEAPANMAVLITLHGKVGASDNRNSSEEM